MSRALRKPWDNTQDCSGDSPLIRPSALGQEGTERFLPAQQRSWPAVGVRCEQGVRVRRHDIFGALSRGAALGSGGGLYVGEAVKCEGSLKAEPLLLPAPKARR